MQTADNTDISSTRYSNVYEQHKYFGGLQEYVLIHKDPGRVFCQRPGRRPESCHSVRDADARAHYARYGRLTKLLASRIDQAKTSDLLPVAVRLHETRQATGFAAIDSESERRVRATEIENTRGSLVHHAVQLGLSVNARQPKYMPLILASGTPEQIKKIADDPRVAEVRLNVTVPAYPTDVGPTAQVSDSNVDVAFNSIGLYGANQRIGMIEFAGTCDLSEDSEAFSYAPPVIYSSAGRSCSVDADCQSCGPYSACYDGNCLHSHGSRVASVMLSGREDGPYAAAMAQLYVYNNETEYDFGGSMYGFSTGCSLDSLLDAYDWFVDNGVRVVNESFTCIPPNAPIEQAELIREVDGVVQDHYGAYGIFVARAAGNYDDLEACPFTNNTMCVGGIREDLQTRYGSYLNWQGSDKEEPDIVARALMVDVADVHNVPAWTKSLGTSFAAPQVAALATLIREHCGNYHAMQLRALMRAYMAGINPSGPRYSTPGLGVDYSDGAGGLFADSSDICGNSGTVLINVAAGEGAPADFPPGCEDCGSPLPQAMGIDVTPRNVATDPGYGDGRNYVTLLQLDPGVTRVRASIDWNAYPNPSSSVGPTYGGAVDFDLVLIREDSSGVEVVYSSQSNDDNNEGFDVDLTRYGAGDYTLLVSFVPGAGGIERVGWAVAYW